MMVVVLFQVFMLNKEITILLTTYKNVPYPKFIYPFTKPISTHHKANFSHYKPNFPTTNPIASTTNTIRFQLKTTLTSNSISHTTNASFYTPPPPQTTHFHLKGALKNGGSCPPVAFLAQHVPDALALLVALNTLPQLVVSWVSHYL